ncbi:hypothetical protein APHNP_0410 [Anaplasma phagocytophilum str. ApNP]|uniref:Uncharacterized protein n=1 Tax=Anaplasma phagocytophilum str. ApNP TaxID=1359153 RepID=A0A0F3NJB3_ANAPH|nr:hypothetical protein APHNP_0410 [Anaplasma phagocytophilum str. ApNP]
MVLLTLCASGIGSSLIVEAKKNASKMEMPFMMFCVAK